MGFPGFFVKEFDIDKVRKILEKYGVAVIPYFKGSNADKYKNEIIDWLCSISDGLTQDHKTWTKYNLPYGPRIGMMQSLIGHCPTVWKIREKLYPLFRDLHQTDQLYTSMDGATVHPPTFDKRPIDWPHIDQTDTPQWCIQGQAVLTDTTASFRCTPFSHLDLWHDFILNAHSMKGDKSNWLKFSDDYIEILKEKFDHWQMPIHVPKGSVILWNSKTIHSAKHNDINDYTWRCVVYVCMRPQYQFSKVNRNTLAKCINEARTTNHWGTRTFPKRPAHRFEPERSESIEKYTKNPELLKLKKPSDLIKKITGTKTYKIVEFDV